MLSFPLCPLNHLAYFFGPLSLLDVSHCWWHWSVPLRQSPYCIFINRNVHTNKHAYAALVSSTQGRGGYACLSMCCDRGVWVAVWRHWPCLAVRGWRYLDTPEWHRNTHMTSKLNPPFHLLLQVSMFLSCLCNRQFNFCSNVVAHSS